MVLVTTYKHNTVNVAKVLTSNLEMFQLASKSSMLQKNDRRSIVAVLLKKIPPARAIGSRPKSPVVEEVKYDNVGHYQVIVKKNNYCIVFQVLSVTYGKSFLQKYHEKLFFVFLINITYGNLEKYIF